MSIFFISIILFSIICVTSANRTPDFVRGFADGAGEKGDILKLRPCLADIESIYTELKKALENFKREETPIILQHGLGSLFDSIRSLMRMLEPCMKDRFAVLSKLKSELAYVSLERSLRKILLQPANFFYNSKKALDCYTQSDFVCSGKNVGAMVQYLLLIKDESDTTGENDLVRGLLVGIKEPKLINDLIPCIHEMPRLYVMIKISLDLFADGSPKTLKKGIIVLLEGMNEFFTALSPCTRGYDVFNVLISKMAHADINEAHYKAMHSTEFRKFVAYAISSMIVKDYYLVGTNIGNLLEIMFLE